MDIFEAVQKLVQNVPPLPDEDYDIFWMQDGQKTIFKNTDGLGNISYASFLIWRQRPFSPDCVFNSDKGPFGALPEPDKAFAWPCGCRAYHLSWKFPDGDKPIETEEEERRISDNVTKQMRDAVDAIWAVAATTL